MSRRCLKLTLWRSSTRSSEVELELEERKDQDKIKLKDNWFEREKGEYVSRNAHWLTTALTSVSCSPKRKCGSPRRVVCDAQGLRADRTETKQVWVRFGGRSRPVDIPRNQEGEFEGTARETTGIQADAEYNLVESGRSIGWKEAERLEDRMVVEGMCRMNGGGQKKNKINQQWKRNTVISEERTSDEWTGSEEENKTEDWEKVIEDGLKEWSRESTQPGGRMHEFVSQAAQVDRKMREEMLEKFGRMICSPPELDADTAVWKMWIRVEEKVLELEKERMRRLFKEKQKEGFFN